MCDVGEYLDYENCKCKKKLVDKLLEECTENVKEVKLAKITSAENENVCKCSSCILYIVLSSIISPIKVGVGSCFLYFHWNLKRILLVLSLVSILKQQFDYWSYKMAAETKSISIKNRTYDFFNEMINLKDFDSNLLKKDKKS